VTGSNSALITVVLYLLGVTQKDRSERPISVILLNSALPDKSRSPLIVVKPSLTSIEKRMRHTRTL